MPNQINFPNYLNLEIKYIQHTRFQQIYLLSLKLPSWEIIGLNLMGTPISKEEFLFVIKKTRKLNNEQTNNENQNNY